MLQTQERKDQLTAPFNSAIDCLMRMGDILRDICNNDANSNLPDEIKQKNKVARVRDFYVCANALLKAEVMDKYKERVEKLQHLSKPVIRNNAGVMKRTTEKKIEFSYELDNELNEILVLIQRDMAEEGLFMPPKNDPRFSWKQ